MYCRADGELFAAEHKRQLLLGFLILLLTYSTLVTVVLYHIDITKGTGFTIEGEQGNKTKNTLFKIMYSIKITTNQITKMFKRSI